MATILNKNSQGTYICIAIWLEAIAIRLEAMSLGLTGEADLAGAVAQ